MYAKQQDILEGLKLGYKEFPVKPKDIKVDTELPSVESVSDRWVSEDSDSFYYEIKKIN